MIDERYWPFKMPPVDQLTPQLRSELDFLETAYREGFRPFAFGGDDYGADSESGRSGHILRRGRTRWEIMLHEDDRRALSAYVGDFSCAARAVLGWLRGNELDSILPGVKEHLVNMPGASRNLTVWEAHPGKVIQ